MARSTPTRSGSAPVRSPRRDGATLTGRAAGWAFPDPADAAPGEEIIGVGADLAATTLLGAYGRGLFPMRLAPGGPLAWWSPDPRGIVPLDGVHVSRSLRRSRRRFAVTTDRAFEAVMRACGDPDRPHGWIDESFVEAYVALHRLGVAHSVEVWGENADGAVELAGGIYGVALGGLFAGESMFHRRTDASKVAFVALAELLRAGGAVLFDVQWCTAHLASLGAIEVSRPRYLELLADALTRPQLVLERA
jgi:leucyl/phenylalanyl-tRNA---protein transferase